MSKQVRNFIFILVFKSCNSRPVCAHEALFPFGEWGCSINKGMKQKAGRTVDSVVVNKVYAKRKKEKQSEVQRVILCNFPVPGTSVLSSPSETIIVPVQQQH